MQGAKRFSATVSGTRGLSASGPEATTGLPASTPSPDGLAQSPHADVRPEWLALWQEPILEPELPIVDPHHHLWDRPGYRYMPHELLDDVGSGHRILGTVFVQCRSMLRAEGPEEMAPVGEVEFVNGAAAMGASGLYGPGRICAGIVGGADLLLGDRVVPVLQAMLAVSGGRLCGIRNVTVWHPDSAVRSTRTTAPPGLLCDPAFQRGAAQLARHALALDVWAYHTQLNEVYALARAIPDLTVVIDHFGGPVGTGPYRTQRDAMLSEWRAGMRKLAELPNTNVKLGGGGMPVLGFDFDRAATPPGSVDLATALNPYVSDCIAWFGVERCMFESNFPVDKGMFSYAIVWNAFKRMAAGMTGAEKTALFSETAISTYRLRERLPSR
jgi:predicted TIM-barrel fold metal-dependent hydrolase